jgi:tetratricopeptide (TPR) repeat protein
MEQVGFNELNHMAPTCRAVILLLLLLPAATSGQTIIELRSTGEHKALAGDTAESARQLALADARRKATGAAVGRLQATQAITALRLTPLQLEAFTAALLEIEEPPAAARSGGAATSVLVRARIDAADAARRMAALRRDQDATFELVSAWTGIHTLHQQLDDQTARRATLSGDAAATAARAQLRTVTTIAVKQLTAKAYAAMARTEPTTVGGRASSEAGRDRAAQFADAALALVSGSPDALYLRGDLYVEVEDPENAEAAYRAALAADVPSSVGRTKLAAALRYQGKTTEALDELAEALRIDPTFARAHSDLGMILRSQRKLPEAIAAYREAIRLDADSTEAHNGLAVALATSGRLEDAVAEFREIVRIDPDSTIGHYNLAYALADLDRDVESAAALREVIRINPEHYNARFNLGELFRLEGKYDDSASQFREYLRLAPDTPQNQRNITRARGYIRQFEDPDAPPVPDGMKNR